MTPTKGELSRSRICSDANLNLVIYYPNCKRCNPYFSIIKAFARFEVERLLIDGRRHFRNAIAIANNSPRQYIRFTEGIVVLDCIHVCALSNPKDSNLLSFNKGTYPCVWQNIAELTNRYPLSNASLRRNKLNHDNSKC